MPPLVFSGPVPKINWTDVQARAQGFTAPPSRATGLLPVRPRSEFTRPHAAAVPKAPNWSGGR